MIAVYWITNLAGIVLMHKAAGKITGKKCGKKAIAKDIAIAVAYTLIIIAAVCLGLLKFPSEYFA